MRRLAIVTPMAALVDLNAVVIDCAEAPPVADFYRQALDGAELSHDSGSVMLRVGGVQLIFREVPGFEPPTWPDTSVPMQVHLDFEVDDLAGTEAALHRLGATTVEYQAHRDEGLIVMRDPAGHLFCIGTRISP
jgi:catechol 2,3-dioxygenase-like lactoylglutathione lyase family enzyme